MAPTGCWEREKPGDADRNEQLKLEAAAMWREAYGEHLTDDECYELTLRLLDFFDIPSAMSVTATPKAQNAPESQ